MNFFTRGTADEKLDLCKEVNICNLMKNGFQTSIKHAASLGMSV